MAIEVFLIFAMTSALVVISPGPTVVLVTSQGAGGGWKAAVFGIVGVMLGTAFYFALAATGLATIIIASQFLFLVIKWIGAGLLIAFGLLLLFGKTATFAAKAGTGEAKRAKLFMQGLLIEIANPKAMIYFTAILPQFIDLSRPIVPQMLIMGATGLTIQFVVYSAYAVAGSGLSNFAQRSWLVSAISKSAGLAMIWAGTRLARDAASR